MTSLSDETMKSKAAILMLSHIIADLVPCALGLPHLLIVESAKMELLSRVLIIWFLKHLVVSKVSSFTSTETHYTVASRMVEALWRTVFEDAG